MGKIIISESQYRKVKQALIESVISTLDEQKNRRIINEMSDDEKINAESVGKKMNREGRLACDTKNVLNCTEYIYPQLSKLKTSDQILHSAKFLKEKDWGKFFQQITASIEIRGNEQIGMMNKISNIFKVAGGTMTFKKKTDENGDITLNPWSIVLKTVPGGGNSQKLSLGAETVGGGLVYHQKNNYNIKSDKGTVLTIPKGAPYSYKKDKKGASFNTGNKFGWFNCIDKTFLVDKVKYKDEKGFLVSALTSNLCNTGSSSKDNQNNKVQVDRSQQPSVASNTVVSDMANYV